MAIIVLFLQKKNVTLFKKESRFMNLDDRFFEICYDALVDLGEGF